MVLWKQEKRLCFWMVVLALYERWLARSQDPAPREGRLMTASHGKALQQQRANEEQSGRAKMERRGGGKGRGGEGDKGEEPPLCGVGASTRCVCVCVQQISAKTNGTD